MTTKVKMGSPIKDLITGEEGILFGYCHNLTGCDSVALKSRELGKDGKSKDAIWVDITRIEVLGDPPPEIQRIVDGKLAGEDTKDPGGPQEVPYGELG